MSQRCAASADGIYSSFTIAGRDSLPAEPVGWISSPLVVPATESMGNAVSLSDTTEERPLLSLRRIAPPGFLIQSFAGDTASDCRS